MSKDMTLRDIGEFGLIDRIREIVGDTAAVAGIGDDAAVIDQEGEHYLLATVDMLVEDVHFRLNGIDAFDLGRRAIAVNVSDISAMGGEPTYALTALAASPETQTSFVETLYRGLHEEAMRFGVHVVGGNTARASGGLILDVMMLGQVPKSELVLRKGARIGDVLVVTGALGEAAATRLLAERHKMERDDSHPTPAVKVPEPRVAFARTVAATHHVHAMVDISDGAAADLHHLVKASGVGAVIYEEAIPVSAATRRAAEEIQMAPLHLALYGGEDYELLLAMPEEGLVAARELAGNLQLYCIGTVLSAEQGVLVEHLGGKREPLPSSGWRHF